MSSQSEVRLSFNRNLPPLTFLQILLVVIRLSFTEILTKVDLANIPRCVIAKKIIN